MFELDFRNITVLISLAIHALLLWIIFRYGRKTPGGRAYSVAIMAIMGWILPMALYRTHLFGQTLLWARLLYVMASFTSTSFFFFTIVFPENKKIPLWLQVLLLLENTIIVFLCFHPSLIIRDVQLSGQGKEDIILWGPLYIIYSTHISGLFLAGFVALYLKLRKAVGAVRKQIGYILGGYFIASNLAMATNLILPWFGYFELNWLGQFFSTLVAVFTTYAILKHRLLNIKLIATEGFILILNFVLFVQFIFSNSVGKLISNAIILMAVFVISYLLIKSVGREIKRREEVTLLAQNLEQSNLRLQELDRQKTDFLSIAAHQLRTPLSVLNGYIELISDGGYGKVGKKIKEILGNMDESNQRLTKLVDEFLDITRIEQGRTKFDFTARDINTVIDSAVQELKDRAEQKGLRIVWRVNKNVPLATIDDDKIRHVVFNFIDNAIKYSDKGAIVLTVSEEQDGMAVRVRDGGFGFDKTDEANFFQKFYRGNNVKGTNVNGTGLGLYVCRMFIEAHHGRIWAHSEGLGKGSEFGFWIPAKQNL